MHGVRIGSLSVVLSLLVSVRPSVDAFIGLVAFINRDLHPSPRITTVVTYMYTKVLWPQRGAPVFQPRP